MVATWLAEAALYPLVNAQPFVSQHLGRSHLAEVRASPAAAAAYRSLQPDARFEVGTRIVEFLRDVRTGANGPVFGIERVEDGWQYWVLDSRGQIEAQGVPALCHGCHAGAFTRPLFGIPRIAGGEESAAELPRSQPRTSSPPTKASKPGSTGL